MLLLTHITSRLRLALVIALPATVAACGEQSANAAPIIDSVDAPLVVSEQNGSYAIPVTILFHDNDGEAITRLHYRLPPSVDGMIDVPAPNPDVQSAQLTIVIQASEAKDDREHGRGMDRNRARALELRIVDGRGAESLPLSSTVTLD